MKYSGNKIKPLLLKRILILLVIGVNHLVLSQERHIYTSLTEAYKEPEKVQILILDGQDLTQLSDSIKAFKNIEILDISYNNFDHFPSQVFDLTSLKELYFSGGYSYIDMYERFDYLIDSIPPEIANLHNLEVLDMSLNSISHLPQELSNLSKLKKLDLWHNYLDQEDLILISSLKNLEELNIGGCGLETLPIEMRAIKNLKYLTLSNNFSEGVPTGTSLKEFPEVIFTYSKLKFLDLSGQNIEEIPSEIGKLKQLEYLILYANSFTKLPEELGKLVNLMELNIDALCLGYWLKMCETEFYLPKSICKMRNLKVIHSSSRIIPEEELERITKCLPKVEFR